VARGPLPVLPLGNTLGNGKIKRKCSLKDNLLIAKEFLNAKKLRTLKGANQNSSLRSSDNDLLEKEGAVLVFWLKF
jgi:hypothetical protein